MRSEKELTQRYLQHSKTVWNICYPYFMNAADTEDAVQETYLRWLTQTDGFSDDDHEKAWLIVTARNVCRDELKRARRRELPLEQAEAVAAEPLHTDETLAAIHKLPQRIATVLYLYYYEGYPTARIAQMLCKREATIRSDLRRGRLKLKQELEDGKC